MTGGLHDPCAGKFGNAGGMPLDDGGGEGLLGGFFGKIEIADVADEGGDDAPPIGAIERLDGVVGYAFHSFDGK